MRDEPEIGGEEAPAAVGEKHPHVNVVFGDVGLGRGGGGGDLLLDFGRDRASRSGRVIRASAQSRRDQAIPASRRSARW